MILNSMTTRTRRLLATSAGVLVLAGASVPAFAQTAEKRLDKVEAEVRALQRKVFPGGDGRFFEPQITPGGSATTATTTPLPATTPVTDMLVRMDSIEAQMRQLTAQVEQNSNRISQLEAKFGAQLPAATGSAPVAPAATGITPASASASTTATTPAPSSNLNAMSGGASAPKPAAPSAARVEAVRAVVKPQTADAGDDEYSYGFRLWDAKFYPEAQQQLKQFLEKYPKHARVSWARNLLGRAYLDDGNPAEAAKWFYQNYYTNERGDRAPDSLLYLAVAMKQLKDTNRACIALAEFSESYASEAAGRLKGLYDSTRSGLVCK